jgi:hypothetical protein
MQAIGQDFDIEKLRERLRNLSERELIQGCPLPLQPGS